MLKVLLRLAFCCTLALSAVLSLTQYNISNESSHDGDAYLHSTFINYDTGNVPNGLSLFSERQLIINDVEVEDEGLHIYWKLLKGSVKTYRLPMNGLSWFGPNTAHLSYLETDLPPPFVA